MGYRLIYTKPAERDLEKIVRYIAPDNPRAAEKLGLELVELAESLTQMPHRGAPVRDRVGVRKIIHPPYILLYRVDEARRMVRVQRFWHAKRDPQTLRTE
jgi:toxin ParE1/3/4